MAARQRPPVLRPRGPHGPARARPRRGVRIPAAARDVLNCSVFFNELVVAYAALLDGTRPEFADPAPYAEFVRLEREALRDEQSVRHFRDLQAELPPPR
ncbi:hypothetical protein ACFVFJ_36155 [Streptomyces sp. NPDC057717]|uniref:hypothetical protein n=1 Tax=Streptomyces sp. NPDC057717 TaxID=3346224 RepID=UPI0036C494D1